MGEINLVKHAMLVAVPLYFSTASQSKSGSGIVAVRGALPHTLYQSGEISAIASAGRPIGGRSSLFFDGLAVEKWERHRGSSWWVFISLIYFLTFNLLVLSSMADFRLVSMSNLYSLSNFGSLPY